MTLQHSTVRSSFPVGPTERLHRVLGYARSNFKRSTSDLKRFIAFPSISAGHETAREAYSCAAWLANHLRAIGLEPVKMVPTPGHPIVFAEWCRSPGRPTVLIYGHYDVQPVEQISDWHSPPFEPAIRGNDLYGRGASDDKGQMFCHVKALEAFLKADGALPVNVKCLFEGEEEIGSTNLGEFLKRHRQALAADVAVISDMQMLGPGRPAVTYSLRGHLGVEIEFSRPGHEVHSGLFGGAILNPLQALCEVIGKLNDESGRIAIP
jgi:acetylornithine deacetylase/succinyl-diaminopimelate desuccinylase-like protein